MFQKSKKIVLLGAGYGGILTAKKLAKTFKKDEEVEITLIDKNSYHTMLTELHEVAAARVPEDAIRLDLKKIFTGRKVNIVLDEITSIDYEKKVLTGNEESYVYDYLVMGTGSRPTYYGCKGAEENTLPLWSFKDAVRIKDHILKMFRMACCEKDEILRKELLTFVVAGSGFTGIEMVGELGEWKVKLCKEFHIDESDITLIIVDMLPSVLPIFNEKLIRKAEKRLHKLGVQIVANTNISEVTKDQVCINETGCIKTKTVIWAAGVESSEILANSDLPKEARNRVVTNEKLQSIAHEEVFVVGDNIFFIPEGEERPVPQMVENAEHSASLVAHNIKSHIRNEELKTYTPVFHGAMVCIGGKYGLAQVGTKNKTYHFSGFLALLIKHFINVIYFIQVAGFNKVWSYMMHEFFCVPDRRSFLGGHFSKASPNFWILPLRLFLGFSWLMEGITKLPKLILDPTNIFLIPQSALIVSSASVATEAEAYGEALFVPEFISNIVSFGMDIFFYNPDGSFTALAVIFQALMVLAEIIVGLCLLGGLFTALASLVSIVMGLMIWSSGMAPYEMLWYIFGGFATVGGSGSTFGLDYYVLPFLKKYWNKISFVKKWYLYID